MIKIVSHFSCAKKVHSSFAFLACIIVLSAALLSCSVPKQQYTTPQMALDATKTALREDRKLSFVSAMSRETLDEHGTKIEFGWSEIRKHFAFMKSAMKIVEDEAFVPQWDDQAPEKVDAAYVWPNRDNARAARRLRVAFSYEGEDYEEDLLFVQELDDSDENSEDSAWIRVGEQWFLREHHPNAKRYQAKGRDEKDRLSWRLVYPYLPFHAKSKLAKKIIASLNKKG